MNSHDGYRVLCGLAEPRQAAGVPALPPFAPQVLHFLQALSAALLADPAAKAYPDVVSFAFFCREKNLLKLREGYDDLEARVGRGLAFHIAPGNVPMNFAYSLLAALLAGNASIVKAPSKPFAQTEITCGAMRVLLETAHQALAPYVTVIEYPRERQDLTELFSAACDMRVIWGGDETIRRVRQAPLKPRSGEITFADRWSLAILDAEYISALDDERFARLVKGIYNDTYLFDQNACTAPRLCVWLGADQALEAAKVRFWGAVHAEAAARYTIDAVTAVDKLTALYHAALLPGGAVRENTPDNRLVRIRLAALSESVPDIHCTGGCFLEYDATTLSDIVPVLVEKTQTIACAGVDPQAVRAFIRSAGVRGGDRAVPIGHTMDFALRWDGYDLIRTLSRNIL